MKDKLLNVAYIYEDDLSDYHSDNFSIADTFKEIILDYKRITKKCKRQGVDIGSSEEKQFEKLFNEGSISEKEFVITDIKDRIVCLMDLCVHVPIKIRKKYCKDLVDLLDDGFDSLEFSEE